MMGRTDRYDRYFLRLISRYALLYTEMVPSQAIMHGDLNHLLAFDPAEHPIALQIGGSKPDELKRCSQIAEEFGYDEVNLNVGCPSDRVVSGQFGACLMAAPKLVADCVDSMTAGSSLPITVKCRIGIDGHDPMEMLFEFVDQVASAGSKTFIVHARKAHLKGLSPKENRTVPPLDYALVHALKCERPDLEIIINGGIETLQACDRHLEYVDGVMLGRAAYQRPYLLADVDGRYFSSTGIPPSRHDVIDKFLQYVERECRRGVPVHAMARHILGLFHGCPGAKAWRAYIGTHAHECGAGPEVIREALQLIERQYESSAA
jgi:tRNA-dihydrouridine synthase A